MQAAVRSIPMLANYTNHTNTPFFLGVGFHKPHIPWTIPTRFFSKSIAETDLPLHPAVPDGMPPIAWNRGLGHNALDSYRDANAYPLHPNVTFPDPLVRAMRRGYRAAVAYMDWMVGNVLASLDASGLSDKTVVVFMGDHGQLPAQPPGCPASHLPTHKLAGPPAHQPACLPASPHSCHPEHPPACSHACRPPTRMHARMRRLSTWRTQPMVQDDRLRARYSRALHDPCPRR